MSYHRVYKMLFAKLYPLLLDKVVWRRLKSP